MAEEPEPKPKKQPGGRPTAFPEDPEKELLKALKDGSLTADKFELGSSAPVLAFLTFLRDRVGLQARMIAEHITKTETLRGDIHKWEAYVKDRLEAPVVWLGVFFLVILIFLIFFIFSWSLRCQRLQRCMSRCMSRFLCLRRRLLRGGCRWLCRLCRRRRRLRARSRGPQPRLRRGGRRRGRWSRRGQRRPPRSQRLRPLLVEQARLRRCQLLHRCLGRFQSTSPS
jgi:hypothetical protein